MTTGKLLNLFQTQFLWLDFYYLRFSQPIQAGEIPSIKISFPIIIRNLEGLENGLGLVSYTKTDCILKKKFKCSECLIGRKFLLISVPLLSEY